MPLRNQFESEAEWLEHMRMYFAAKALSAIYKDYWEGVRLHEFSCDDETWPMNLAMDSYRMADAMIAAREAKP